jgi:phospholipid/cholesterol/gamma-HCH transport system ATP-binding protein
MSTHAPIRPPADASPVEVRDLHTRFGTQVIHDGLSMEVRRGEIFGVIGGSGAGKSVLLRTILGLQAPQSGHVLLYGQDLATLSGEHLRAVKQGYGVTFQQGALFSSLTVAQNVQLPLIEACRLPTEVLDGLAELKLRLVGLPEGSGAKYPAQLSGGMVKRAALARALILDPELLFLDEPTSGLDPIGAAAFDELILQLQNNLHLTVVMVTHDLDSIYRICNRVGVLVDGRMISDTLDGIFRNEQLWIHQYFHASRGLAARAGRAARSADAQPGVAP